MAAVRVACHQDVLLSALTVSRIRIVFVVRSGQIKREG